MTRTRVQSKLMGVSALVLALSGTAIADGPKVYGKINGSLEREEVKAGTTTKTWEFNSNASRLGVKGDVELNHGLEAVYKLEYETFVDDGAKDVKDSNGDKGPVTFSQRNIYGGVKGNFGEVIIGKFDTPTKKAQGKIDLFNDLSGDIKNYLVGETRASNAIQYKSPKIADVVTVKLAVMPGEDNSGVHGADDGIADYRSASVEFKNDLVRVALANDRDVKSGSGGVDLGKGTHVDINRIAAEIKAIDNLAVGVLFQDAEEANPAAGAKAMEDDSLVVSAKYKMGDYTLKAQVGDTEGQTSKTEVSQRAIGVDYKLGKKTKVFAFITELEEDPKVGATTEENNSGIGFEHKF